MVEMEGEEEKDKCQKKKEEKAPKCPLKIFVHALRKRVR